MLMIQVYYVNIKATISKQKKDLGQCDDYCFCGEGLSEGHSKTYKYYEILGWILGVLLRVIDNSLILR